MPWCLVLLASSSSWAARRGAPRAALSKVSLYSGFILFIDIYNIKTTWLTCGNVGETETRAAPLAGRVAVSYLREVMRETIKGAQHALELIQQVVKREDPPLWRALVHDGMGPQFALSWLLTWFAHDLRSLPQVFVLFFFPSFLVRARHELAAQGGEVVGEDLRLSAGCPPSTLNNNLNPKPGTPNP
jgi:hypothetical protein